MIEILTGDCREILKTLPSESVHYCVTSPPYFGLRDYGVGGQIGLEPTPDAFVAELVDVFREVRRVLRDDGTLWLNLGDSYASGPSGTISRKSSTLGGSQSSQGAFRNATSFKTVPDGLKQKDLIGIPWMVAFALRADGWYLRQDLIWSKPNPMPESVTDRCTKAHEYIFLLSKSARYFYDQKSIMETLSPASVERLGQNTMAERGSDRVGRASGDVYTAKAFGHPQSEPRGPASNFGIFEKRNKRSVWEVVTQPYSDAHFATFPPALIEPCIKAGCPEGGKVLDPFGGAGTTGLVADRLRRNSVLIELNPEYAEMARSRIHNDAPLFAGENHAQA